MQQMLQDRRDLAGRSPNSPWLFFALVYALSAPWWVLALFVRRDGLPDNLPITDVGATFMPMLAAIILAARESGATGVRRLLARVFDARRVRGMRWWAVTLLFMPMIYVATYALMRALGISLPLEWSLPPAWALVFFAFFFAAAGEEVGYTGYATEALQRRFSPLLTGLIIGIPWAFWHLPSMIQLGQVFGLIVIGLVVTVAYRVLYVWLYNGSGSLFAVILLHAIGNTGRTFFPGGRAAFEQQNAVVGYGLVIGVVLVVGVIASAIKPRR